MVVANFRLSAILCFARFYTQCVSASKILEGFQGQVHWNMLARFRDSFGKLLFMGEVL